MSNENNNSNSNNNEIDYSVRVALRTRPLSQKEINERSEEVIKYIENSPQVSIGKDQTFTFDYVFNNKSKQSDIFNDCVYPLVDSLFEGYNSTILAYGQTGSGKTFTMGTGTTVGIDPEELGVIPRVIDLVFDKVEKKRSTHQMVIKVSFLELYNEEIKDMLNPYPTPGGLPIRENSNGEVYVQGLVEEVVRSRNQMEDALIRGSQARTTGSTLMNFHSSRSHAIFSIIIEQTVNTTNTITNSNSSPVSDTSANSSSSGSSEEIQSDEKNPSIRSQFHFVDLAGSERIKKTKAEGQRLKEGININGGLLALGNVISALGDTRRQNNSKPKHIPYRDSKLTRMLQSSLGGNSRTLMIACISPADSNFEETLNTLKYAYRARNIMNKPIVNVDPITKQLLMYKQQIQILKNELLKCTCRESDDINNLLNQSESSNNKKSIASSTTTTTSGNNNNNNVEDNNIKNSNSNNNLKSIGNEETNKMNFELTMKVSQMEFENNMLQEIANKVNSKYKLLLGKFKMLEEISLNYTNNYTPALKDDDESQFYSDYFEQLNNLLNNQSNNNKNQNNENIIQNDNNSNNNNNNNENNDENQIQNNEIKEIEEFEQSSVELSDLNQFINEKEEELEVIAKTQQQIQQMKEQYDNRLRDLESKLELMKDEKERELKSLEKKNEKDKSAENNNYEDEKQRLTQFYEKKLNELKLQLDQHQRSKKEIQRLQESKSKMEEKVVDLQDEIKDMKKQKTDILKKMRDELKKKDDQKQIQTKELDQLKKEARKSEVLIGQLKNQSKQKDLLLQKKIDESEQIKKKLKDTESSKLKLLTQMAKSTVPKPLPGIPGSRNRNTIIRSKVNNNNNNSNNSKDISNWRKWFTNQIQKNLEKNQLAENLNSEIKKKEKLVRESNELRKSNISQSLKMSKLECTERSQQLEVKIKGENEKISRIQKDLAYVSNECLDTPDILGLISNTSFEKLPNIIQTSLELCIEYAEINRLNDKKYNQQQKLREEIESKQQVPIEINDDDDYDDKNNINDNSDGDHSSYSIESNQFNQRILPSTLKENIKFVKTSEKQQQQQLTPSENNHLSIESLNEIQKLLFNSSNAINGKDFETQQLSQENELEINNNRNSFIDNNNIDNNNIQEISYTSPSSPSPTDIKSNSTTDDLSAKVSSIFDELGKISPSKPTSLPQKVSTTSSLSSSLSLDDIIEDHSVFDKDILDVEMIVDKKSKSNSLLSSPNSSRNNKKSSNITSIESTRLSPLLINENTMFSEFKVPTITTSLSPPVTTTTATATTTTNNNNNNHTNDVFTRLSGPRPESRLKNYKVTNYTSSINGKGKDIFDHNGVGISASWTFGGHDGSVYGLLFDDNIMYSCGQDKLIKSWDLSTGNFLSDLKCNGMSHSSSGPVKTITLASNGLLFSGGSDKSITIWDIRSPLDSLKKKLKVQSDVLSLTTFGNLVVGGLENGTFKVWDIRSLKSLITPITKKQYHTGSIFSLAHTSKYLVSASRDHTINIFHRDTLEFVQNLHPQHYDGVTSLCIDTSSNPQNEDIIYSGSRDRSIKRWEVLPNNNSNGGSNSGFISNGSSSLKGSLDNFPYQSPISLSSSLPITTLNTNNNNNNINTNNNNNNIYTQSKLSNNSHTDWVNSLTMYNNHLYSGGRDSTIKGWDLQLSSCIQLIGHDASINCLISGKDMILSGSNDKSIKLWKPNIYQ